MAYDSLPEVLTVKQAAEFLQVATITIQRSIKTGKLKAFKIGSEYRIYKEDLISLIEKQ